jgi:hypothetical protein
VSRWNPPYGKDEPNTNLPGTVEKIIKAFVPSEPEKTTDSD